MVSESNFLYQLRLRRKFCNTLSGIIAERVFAKRVARENLIHFREMKDIWPEVLLYVHNAELFFAQLPSQTYPKSSQSLNMDFNLLKN